jgi:hypothetical protein
MKLLQLLDLREATENTAQEIATTVASLDIGRVNVESLKRKKTQTPTRPSKTKAPPPLPNPRTSQ